VGSSALSQVDEVAEQVRLTLQRRGVRFEEPANGRFRIQHGSADVDVEVRSSAGATVIKTSALVLDAMDADSETELRVLRSLNDRNRALPYGKFWFDAEKGEVAVEYDMLGDHLQDPELMTALVSIAGLADDHDDLLQEELGTGRRAADRAGRDVAPPQF
jgi:Putative bacterial sensory transduction regulator